MRRDTDLRLREQERLQRLRDVGGRRADGDVPRRWSPPRVAAGPSYLHGFDVAPALPR
jgi:hypothetical protein